jgi:hypothetical protein
MPASTAHIGELGRETTRACTNNLPWNHLLATEKPSEIMQDLHKSVAKMAAMAQMHLICLGAHAAEVVQ